MIKIFFPISPKPIQSVKIGRVGNFAKAFQPKKNVSYKGQIKYLAQKHMEDNDIKIINGPIRVCKLEYRFAPLKNFPKKKLKAIKEGEIIYKDTRPDLMDNLNKGLFDALSNVVYKDDSQIVESLLIRKYYSNTPGIYLELEEI